MQRALPFIVFVIVLGFARIFGALTSDTFANFQPLGALFFCGMALFGWRGLCLPALAWVMTYPMTSLAQGYEMGAQLLIPVAGFVGMIALAAFFKGSNSGRIFVGSLAAAVIFYVLTNVLSWAFDPLYGPKSLATLGQALWTGLPGYPPTWVFFRNAMVAQSLFSAIFLIATSTVPVALQKRDFETAS